MMRSKVLYSRFYSREKHDLYKQNFPKYPSKPICACFKQLITNLS